VATHKMSSKTHSPKPFSGKVEKVTKKKKEKGEKADGEFVRHRSNRAREGFMSQRCGEDLVRKRDQGTQETSKNPKSIKKDAFDPVCDMGNDRK